MQPSRSAASRSVRRGPTFGGDKSRQLPDVFISEAIIDSIIDHDGVVERIDGVVHGVVHQDYLTSPFSFFSFFGSFRQIA